MLVARFKKPRQRGLDTACLESEKMQHVAVKLGVSEQRFWRLWQLWREGLMRCGAGF